ncbi:hypothetical protein VTG60DRAFT_3240 [Thermothelomyces hinnuleus]
MVNFALSLITLAITTATSVVAGPAEASKAVVWVEDIIAHPDTAASVDEAVAAAEAADVVGSSGGLQARANCNKEQFVWKAS